MTEDLAVSWLPGACHGIVWPAGLAMIDAATPIEVARHLWWSVRRDCDLGTFLEQLARQAGTSLLQLPSFAVVLDSGAGVKCAVRGGFTVRVTQADGDEVELTGAGVSTWAERGLGSVSSITLVAAGHDLNQDPDQALGEGCLRDALVQADVLRAAAWQTQPAAMDRKAAQSVAAVPGPEFVPPVAVQPTEGESPASRPAAGGAADGIGESLGRPDNQVPAAPDEPSPAVSDPATLAPAADAHEAPAAEAPSAATLGVADDEPAGADPAVAEPAEADQLVADQLVADQPDAPVERRFAHLWDATSIQPIEAAAVREPVFIDEVPPAGAEQPVPVSQPDTPAAASTPARSLADEWERSVADEWDAEDHDGHTVMQLPPSGDLPVGGISPTEVVTHGEMVLAIRCTQQHPNPPQRARCYLCGASCGGGATQAQRPPLGRVRVSTGEVLELSQPIIIGRSPRAGRTVGSVIPRLLALPFQHVSGTHLEISFEGWSVLAVDRHSTNGTFLRREGESPVRLPEAPTLLIEHDVLDLGHGVQLTMEGLP